MDATEKSEKRIDTKGIQELVYVARVIKILDCSKSCVYNLIKDGELEAIRLGKKGIRITKASLRHYIESQRIDPKTYFK